MRRSCEMQIGHAPTGREKNEMKCRWREGQPITRTEEVSEVLLQLFHEDPANLTSVPFSKVRDTCIERMQRKYPELSPRSLKRTVTLAERWILRTWSNDAERKRRERRKTR